MYLAVYEGEDEEMLIYAVVNEYEEKLGKLYITKGVKTFEEEFIVSEYFDKGLVEAIAHDEEYEDYHIFYEPEVSIW